MASELETIKALYRYNERQRARYLDAIWKLPEKERYRDRGASFPSLVDVYLHVLDAYRFWFDCVLERHALDTVPEYPLGLRLSRPQARRETGRVNETVQRVLAKLGPTDLDQRRPDPRPGRGSPKVRTILIHMVEEELQHRGELNALFWQIDRDPPVLGFHRH